jgi:hypothetical protein
MFEIKRSGFRISENRMLRGISGPKRDEVTGENCIIRSFTLYSSTNIIRMIKSRRMRWVGHAACIGEMRNAYKILV